MGKKTIEQNLRNVLLGGQACVQALFEYELEEHIDEYRRSKQRDGDVIFFAVTEHSDHVAMLLIDEHDVLHVNEQARAALQRIWGAQYATNTERIIPSMVEDLDAGFLFAAGVRVVDTRT